MKKLTLLIILFCAYISYAQVQGCVWTAALDTVGETDEYQCRSAMEFFYITVALVDSADSIIVYSGTNLPDSTYDDEIYTQVSLKDITDGEIYQVISGDEATHTYMPLWGYKRKNIRLEAYSISDTTVYYLESY